MNPSTVTTLAAAAVLSLSAVAHADSCDASTLSTALASTDVVQCSTDSGYSFSSLVAPSEVEMALMCASSSCQTALEAVEALGLGDCTVGSSFAFESDLVQPVVAYCAALASTDDASTATSSASTGDDVAATVAPADSETSGSTDTEIVEPVEPVELVASNTTSSATDDVETKVGDSDSGSDLEVETPTPTAADASASEETEEKTSASASVSSSSSSSSSDTDTETSSGSNSGASIAPVSVVMGSAIAASVIALFL